MKSLNFALALFLSIFLSAHIQGQGRNQLSDFQTEQLFKLCKVWGFMKYYHPNVTKGRYDWDQELIDIAPEIVGASFEDESNELMFRWASEKGEATISAKIEVSSKIKLQPDLRWLQNHDLLGEELSKFLVSFIKAKRTSKSQYVRINNHPNFIETGYEEFEFRDSYVPLLALFRYWNIIEYFYPYRYLTNNWDQVLRTYIPQFYEVQSSLEYKLTFKRLITEINDTHAYLFDTELSEYFGSRSPAIDCRKIENKIVVFRIISSEKSYDSLISRGDIITAINGRPIEDVLKTKMVYSSGSNTSSKTLEAIRLAFRTNLQKLEVTLEDGSRRTLPTFPYHLVNYTNQRKDPYLRIGSDIGYIYIGSILPNQVQSALQSFTNTRGLILDLRGYPQMPLYETLISNLAQEPYAFTSYTIGSANRPGKFAFLEYTGKAGGGKYPYLQPVVAIVDETTLSQPENYAMAIKLRAASKIVGVGTSGADGDVAAISLPGNIFTMITGVGIYYPDGGETQGIGIVPDIEVIPTIKAIKEGRDELLDKAIEVLINQSKR